MYIYIPIILFYYRTRDNYKRIVVYCSFTLLVLAFFTTNKIFGFNFLYMIKVQQETFAVPTVNVNVSVDVNVEAVFRRLLKTFMFARYRPIAH